MPKRSRVEAELPGTSSEKRALYDLAITEPVTAVMMRTGVDPLLEGVALPYGCSLCVAPCHDEAGHPGTAVFVMDHVRRVAFEMRPRSSEAIAMSATAPREVLVDGEPSHSASPLCDSPPPAPAHVQRSKEMTPPAFYEDVQLPPVSTEPVAEPATAGTPAGAASTAVPLDVQMPVDLLERHRNAILYCHLCRVYVPPHVVNLEAHLNSRHIHQRVQDDLIAEAVKTGTLVDARTARTLSVRELADRQAKNAQRPPSVMVSEKNYEGMPTFIVPRSLITEKARDDDAALRSFWYAGLDVVHPYCALCEEIVSLQLLAAHKRKPKHRELYAADMNAHGNH